MRREDNLRWTDGRGVLPVKVFGRFRGAVEVVLSLPGTMRYPDCGRRVAVA